MNDSEVEEKAKFFVSQYAGDVSSELVQEILHLKAIHTSNLGKKPLNPIYLIKKLAKSSAIDEFVSKLLRGSAHLLHIARYCSTSRTVI